MTQKNETPVLLLSLLVTVALLGGGLWWFSSRFLRPTSTSPAPSGNAVASSPVALQDRLSTGEKSLIPSGALIKEAARADKEKGIAAIAAKDYAQAVTALEAALQAQKNDPESLIYLNNARIADGKAYTIAVAVPIDSDVAASLEILRGVAQAQDQLNQTGGIAGVPLRVIIADDGNQPQIAQQVATQLADNPEVLAVVGHFASGVTLAAGEVYNQKQLVAISPVSTSVKLSNFSRYVFRTVPSDFVAARALADYMLTRLQQQQAAVFYNSQSEYSQSLKSEFSSALALGGGQVVSEVDLSSPEFSAADSLKQANQQGAKVLALLPDSSQLDRALQVIQVNRRQLALLAGDDVYALKTLAVAGDQAEGLVVAVPWHILSEPQSAFVQTSRSLWGADVNWRTATAYDATEALIAALKQSPTRQGIQQALASPSFSTSAATGVVRFLPSGDRNRSVQLVIVAPGTRSGYGYDFQPLPQ